MKKEILFKAKRFGQKTWIQGYYLKHIDLQMYATGDSCHKTEHHFLIPSIFCNGSLKPPLRTIEITPETLCLYTGFTDKNGRKIWEHDLVRAYETSSREWMVNEVLFEYGCFKLTKENHCDALLCRYMAKDLEVVGNRFDEAVSEKKPPPKLPFACLITKKDLHRSFLSRAWQLLEKQALDFPACSSVYSCYNNSQGNLQTYKNQPFPLLLFLLSQTSSAILLTPT